MLLTAALAAGRLQTDGPYDPAASYDLPALARVFDFINLMSYDMGKAAWLGGVDLQRPAA